MSIFVNIASFCDPYLEFTLDGLYDKACKSEDIFVGLIDQWAAPGLEDTLLRCQIQPEYLNGHYQKEVQQGI